MNCPAVCATDGDTTARWWVHYRKSGRDYPSLPQVTWTRSDLESSIPRFVELAHWVSQIVTDLTPRCIVLEDYAFSAAGRLTQLGENAGILKATLLQHHPTIPLHVVAPTTMKKFATGRGIATKDDIWAAFISRYPACVTWDAQCHPRGTKITSPMADVADSYFLAQYGYQHLFKT